MRVAIQGTRSCVVLLVLAVCLPSTASAGTFDVTVTVDELDATTCPPGGPDCSLREAIIAANGTEESDVIRIPAGTYEVALAPAAEPNAQAGDFDISGDVAIQRSGGGTVTIDAADPGPATDRVFDIASTSTDVVVSDITITHGNASFDGSPSSQAGGAIRTRGQLTLNRVALTANTALGNNFAGGGGGAVKVLGGGSLQANDSTFTANKARRGAAINVALDHTIGQSGETVSVVPASATLDRSVVRDNETTNLSTDFGGAVWAWGSFTVRNSEITGNLAGHGGGLYVIGQPGAPSAVTFQSATVSGNEARNSDNVGGGGGLTLVGRSALTIEDSTVASNRAALRAANIEFRGQVSGAPSVATFRRALFADGQRLPSGSANGCFIDPNGGLISVESSHSLDDDDTCALDDPTDRPDANPALAPLGNNGGPTRTHALGNASSAIDAGGSGCPATDQRGPGFARPLGNACDVGAFESTGSATPDDDGDGFSNSADNCPSVSNPTQANADADAQGDACDGDDDADGILDGADNCPLNANPGQENTDGLPDGGDACDGDDDQDGVTDGADNCRTSPNAGQTDGDQDGIGDACEPGVKGHVDLDGVSSPGATVTLCVRNTLCLKTETNGSGDYAFSSVQAGEVILSASARGAVRPETVTVNVQPPTGVEHDFALRTVAGPPKGTTVSPVRALGAGDMPTINWGQPFDLEHRTCRDAKVTYSVIQNNQVIRRGAMIRTTEDVNLYRATVTPAKPAHGFASITIDVKGCRGSSTDSIDFSLYIDPSGNVRDLRGRPIVGATVSLYRSETPVGPFEFVPDGSLIMSPSNRKNSDSTDANGHFGWDVVPGFYTVRAHKPGCKVPPGGRNTAAYAETRVMEIPPPVFDLDIRLDCPYKPKLVLGALPKGTFNVSKQGTTSYRLTNRSPFKVTGTLVLMQGKRKVGARTFKIAANRGANVVVTLSRTARASIVRGAKLKANAVVNAKGPAKSKASAKRGITLRAAPK